MSLECDDLGVERHPGGLLKVKGPLDLSTSWSLIAEGEELVSAGHQHLIIDCHDVTFCDSYGLRALLELNELVAPNGSVMVARPTEMLCRLFEVTGLGEVFEVTGRGR